MKSLVSLLVLVLACSVQAQPYEPHVIWDRSGETDSSAYGYKILPLGDQNDDGFADWAVYAQGNGGAWQGTQRPYVEFFHGDTAPETMPYFIYRADTIAYRHNWYAFATGDVNGDGYQDWTAQLWEVSLPPTYTVLIFQGGPNADSVADVQLHIPTGSACYPLGDFNLDGYDDQYWVNNDGTAWIYYGGSPMDTIPGWVIHEPPAGINTSVPYAYGDFNGDGASDFMCFDMNNGNLAVFLGGADPDTVPDYFWSNALFPYAGIDSLNGDNADEWGGTYVHFGRPILSPVPDAILNSIAGSFAVDGGDFNGDGYHDLILFAQSTLTNPFGAFDLHLGHPWLNPDPVFTIEGNVPPFNLRGIYTAAGLGDVNGDTLDDFAIGAWNETFGPWRGRCVIISGDTLRVSADPTRPELPHDITIEAYPNPFNSATTIRLTLPWSQKLNELTIYNALGQTVRHETLPPFVSQVTYGFDVRELPTGTYFLTVRSGNFSRSQKLILLR